MGIAVNRVALGYNYAKGSDIYQRIAGACAVGTGLFDGSSLICKAGGVAWFVAPRSSQIICTRVGGGETAAVDCAVLVTGLSGWFVPTIGQLENPGYCCRVNWVTCTPGVGVSTNYTTRNPNTCTPGVACAYASTSIGQVFKGPTTYYIQNFADGIIGCYDINDTSCAFYRTFRCVTY